MFKSCGTFGLGIWIYFTFISSSMALDDFKYPKNIIELTTNNFNETVIESKDIWIVAFFAPWCPYCKQLMPKYLEVANALEGIVKIGAVNGDKYKKLTKRFHIDGFPSVIIFALDKNHPKEYKGKNAKKLITTALRIARGEIINWEELEKEEDKREDINFMPKHHNIIQITSEETFLIPCQEAQTCIISFLPDLTTCPKHCRSKLLSNISKAKKYFSNENWQWLWAEERTQKELEEYLFIDGSKYPAMSAYVFERKRSASYFGELTSKLIIKFLNKLKDEIVKTKIVRTPALPDINEVEPWREEDLIVPMTHTEL